MPPPPPDPSDPTSSPLTVSSPPADPAELTRDADPGATRSAAGPDPSATRTAAGMSGAAAPPHAGLLAGRYALGEVLGEGGMGTVYRAEQVHPVRRTVAVKLIKPGMDSARVVTRFEAERQALALMDHPHIARVLDGGTTDRGQPFFVMELVNGTPLTAFCDANRLTVRQRLDLFVLVCQAVQHAHQKGVMHRDLKPSNILVAEVDGKAAPKVIDFGLAKALQAGAIPDVSLDTAFGSVLGTPLYMSPEQADPGTADIDTRADVYALGVILYELLVGSTPVTRDTLKNAAVGEMLRLVREAETPPPTARLKAAADLPNIAAVRNTEPGRLAKEVRGDLEWIALKCLEKDRGRRYETANGLAADVQRYLADEPVVAGRPSRWYKARKFVRRNRGPVMAAALVLLALVAGVIGTTLGLLRAEAKAAEARVAAESERQAKAAETEQRKAAERANRQAFEALKSFTDELMGKVLGNKDKLTDTDKAVLRNAQKQWEVFAQSKGDSPEARVIRSEGAAELAILQDKLGMTAEAEANDRLALQIRAGLATEFPSEPLYRLKLGMSHWNLGNNLRGSGNRAEAEANYTTAVAIFQSLVAEFPEDANYRQRLGQTYNGLANAKRARSNWAEAEGHYRDAIAIQKRLTTRYPESDVYRNGETNSHWGLAFTLKRAEKVADSEVEYRLALEMMEKLAADFPGESWYRQQSANLARELGVFLYDLGEKQKDKVKVEAGAKLFPKAIDVLEKLAAEFPSLPVYRSDLIRCHRDYGKVLGLLDNRVEGAEQFRKAIARCEKLAADHPTVLPYRADLGLCYSYFADFLQDGDTPADSLEWYGKAIRTLTAAYETDRQVFLTKRALSKCHVERANALDHLSRHAEALPDRDKALVLCTPEMRDVCRSQRADTRLRSGQVAEAIAEVDELSKIESKSPGHWFHFAKLYAIASVKIEAKKGEYADRAVELLRKAVAVGFKDAAKLANSADLDPLRGRADFQKLLAVVEVKTPPKPEVLPPPRKE